jgi:hypothetical protein
MDIGSLQDVLGHLPPTDPIDQGSFVVMEDEVSQLKIDAQRGRVVYSHPSRLFVPFDRPELPRPPEEQAVEIMLGLAEALGIDAGEMGPLDINTVVTEVGYGASNTSERFEQEFAVTLYREVEGIPVHGSRVKATIGFDGLISQVIADWPQFLFSDTFVNTRPPSTVADHLSSLSGLDMEHATVEVWARLEYIPIDHPLGHGFVPGIRAQIYDTHMEYLADLTVPVLE